MAKFNVDGIQNVEVSKKLPPQMSPSEQLTLMQRYTDTHRACADLSKEEREVRCLRVLCDYLHLLESWKVQYAPKTLEDVLDDRFVEACQMLDYVEYLADFLIAAELGQRIRIVEMLNKDGLIASLEERLERQKKEGTPYEEKQSA